MQPKQNTPILQEDDNISSNLGPYEDEKSILKEQDIEEDHRYLVSKSPDIRSYIRNCLSGRTSEVGLLRSKSSLSLREIRLNNQEFIAGTPVSNMKYNHLRF